MMKILFLFLFFSLNAFSIDLEEKTVYLPADLAGVKLKNKSDPSVKLKLTYKIYNKEIVPRENSKTDMISFLSNLFYIYQSSNKSKLLEVFDEQAKRVMLKQDSTDIQIKVMAQIKKPFLKSIQKFEDGYLVRWSDISFRDERKIYLKYMDNKYYISTMNIPKSNTYFWNTNLYFKYQKFKQSKPVIISSFSSIKDTEIKDLKIKIGKEMKYINIFKSTDKVVNLVAIDNYKSKKYPFKDHDNSLGKIWIKFSGKNFKKTKDYKLFLIESTYPLGTLNKDHLIESTSFELKKI